MLTPGISAPLLPALLAALLSIPHVWICRSQERWPSHSGSETICLEDSLACALCMLSSISSQVPSALQTRHNKLPPSCQHQPQLPGGEEGRAFFLLHTHTNLFPLLLRKAAVGGGRSSHHSVSLLCHCQGFSFLTMSTGAQGTSRGQTKEDLGS